MADTVLRNAFVNQDMTGSLTSPEISLNNLFHYAAHIAWTGTPTGTLFLEANAEPTGLIWETIASVPVTGIGSQMWLDRNAPYVKIRLRYIPTAGTGTMNGSVVAKGDL